MTSIDIAVPCYNYGRFLPDSVGSVFAQGVDDVRVLIVDNASTDDSVAIARGLAERYGERVEIVAREENQGPHASFNEGVTWARADYFMVLCADDILAPGCLASAAGFMDARPEIAFAYGDDVHLTEGEEPPPADGAPASWRVLEGPEFIAERCRNPARYIAAGMVLVRTAAQKAAGLYRPELPHTDDFELLLRLALFGSVARTDAVLGYKRMHAGNQTHEYVAERTRDLRERLAAIESFFDNEGARMANADRLRSRGREGVAERAYWSGLKDFARGRESGRDLLGLAFTLSPRMRFLPPLGYLLRSDRPLGAVVSDLLPRGASRSGDAHRSPSA